MTLHREAAVSALVCTARPDAAASNVTTVDGCYVSTQGRSESHASESEASRSDAQTQRRSLFEKLRVSLGVWCHESRL
jgi:hypothetical protein